MWRRDHVSFSLALSSHFSVLLLDDHPLLTQPIYAAAICPMYAVDIVYVAPSLRVYVVVPSQTVDDVRIYSYVFGNSFELRIPRI